MRRNIAVLGLFLCFGAVFAKDDPNDRAKTEKMIVDGLTAFRERADQTCVDLLHKVISRINASLEGGLAGILPKKFPQEFVAGKVKSSSGTWGNGANTFQWRSVTQRWTSKSGVRINVTASNSPQMVKAGRMGFDMYKNNAQMKAAMAAQGTEISEREGFGIMISNSRGRPSVQIFGKLLMLQIQLSAGEKKIVTDAIDSLDWAKMKKADERK